MTIRILVDLPPKKELLPDDVLESHRIEVQLRYMMRLGVTKTTDPRFHYVAQWMGWFR
jgi:hypothetical protein